MNSLSLYRWTSRLFQWSKRYLVFTLWMLFIPIQRAEAFDRFLVGEN
ncbi:MAG: hypothetical protein V8Q76_01680 [Bacteroides intestinalis]